MAWETQRGGPWGGGGGGGQGPWGGGGQGGGGPRGGPQPPDIEEMLRRSQDKFKKFIPSGGGGSKRAVLLVALAILVWLATGFYRVQPGEEGVELLFGEFVKRTSAGLNYWVPAPIGQVFTPNVENTNVTSVGFREFGASGTRNSNVRDVAEESLMLTGDQNIIDIDYVVQWRIKNAADFLFNIRAPEATVKLASESAIREVVGQTTLEDALARRRTEVETKTQEVLQKILDSYGAGVFVASIKLQKVEPPNQVIDAFNDVQRARQDKERQQNEADAYRNDIVPKAKGEAERMIQEATGYKERLVREAEGEAKRFLSVYEAYTGGRDVTRARLYLERMQQVFKDSEKVIVDPGEGGTGVLPYLPLPELRKRTTGGDAQ